MRTSAPGAPRFTQLQDPMFVIRSGGLIESAHAQPVLA